jgi:hypothetical protein
VAPDIKFLAGIRKNAISGYTTSGASQRAILPIPTQGEDAMFKTATVLKSTVAALALLTAAAAALAAGSARAAETDLWETVGGWQVRVDHSLSDACYMAAGYPESGTVLRFGFLDRAATRVYLSLENPAWGSLIEGQDYWLAANLAGYKSYKIGVRAERNAGGLIQLNSTIISADLVAELANARGIAFWFEGRGVGNFSLKDSAAAMHSTAACQIAMARTHNPDPFAASPRSLPSRDPFRGT